MSFLYGVTSARLAARQMGFRDAALYALARSAAWISGGRLRLYKYYFMSQPVPHGALLPPRRGQAFSVHLVGPDHPFAAAFPRPPAVIARRFRDGAVCFLARKGDIVAGFLWLQAPSYDEDEVRSRFVPLPAGRAVWDFDVHVEQAHRAGFAFACLWDAANAFLRERGVRWSVSRVSAFNPMSLNSHLRLGARPLGSAFYLVCAGWQVSISDLLPRWHFSRGPDNVPQVALHADREPRGKCKRFSR